VQRYIHQKLLREFMNEHFIGPREEFFFHGGEVSTATLADLQPSLRNTARQCADIIARDRGLLEQGRGVAFVLAL
jgi:hypothetical protein